MDVTELRLWILNRILSQSSFSAIVDEVDVTVAPDDDETQFDDDETKFDLFSSETMVESSSKPLKTGVKFEAKLLTESTEFMGEKH